MHRQYKTCRGRCLHRPVETHKHFKGKLKFCEERREGENVWKIIFIKPRYQEDTQAVR